MPAFSGSSAVSSEWTMSKTPYRDLLSHSLSTRLILQKTQSLCEFFLIGLTLWPSFGIIIMMSHEVARSDLEFEIMLFQTASIRNRPAIASGGVNLLDLLRLPCVMGGDVLRRC